MKKLILLSMLVLFSHYAKADIEIKNNTLCPYVLSIPGYGYYQVPAGYNFWLIMMTPFVSNLKVAIWSAYPNPPIVDQVDVDVITTPWGTSTSPNCSGNPLTVHYSILPNGNTFLELFN